MAGKQPAWKTQCDAQRAKLKALGWPFHAVHPLAAAQLAGGINPARAGRQRAVEEDVVAMFHVVAVCRLRQTGRSWFCVLKGLDGI